MVRRDAHKAGARVELVIGCSVRTTSTDAETFFCSRTRTNANSGQDAICEEKLGTHTCWCPPGDQLQYAVIRGVIIASCVHPTTSKHGFGRVAIIIIVSVLVFLLLLLLLAAVVLNKHLKARKAKKPKEKNFKLQNHAMLLSKMVDKDIAENMLFTLEELENATNGFDETRKIGGGGHGTVYRGVLANNLTVAIKKSKVTVQREIEGFINEVALLSTINHRNVIRLLGCCLETEVPLLVYEFISNGTLSQHLHVEGHQSLSWVDRLRIAVGIANAIGYLHSSASTAIIHRDIKTDNILLDDRLTPKLSDFGTSRGIPIENAGVTTGVQGTIGYVDPEYCQTRHLTEKSDVYSFGAVLVELLTRRKPFTFLSLEQTGIISHFNSLISLGKICEILNPQVILEAGRDAEVDAELAATCLVPRGDDIPTMRQLEMKLQELLPSNNSTRQDFDDEGDDDLDDQVDDDLYHEGDDDLDDQGDDDLDDQGDDEDQPNHCSEELESANKNAGNSSSGMHTSASRTVNCDDVGQRTSQSDANSHFVEAMVLKPPEVISDLAVQQQHEAKLAATAAQPLPDDDLIE